MSNLIYLASPYSKYPGGREEAYKEVCRVASSLMLLGEKVFCPIAHSHSIEVESNMPVMNGDFWLEQDFAVLKHCDLLMVYQMPGWEDSIGVAAEIGFAEDHGIPVEYIRYESNVPFFA